jgi:hypothetical protein
MSRTSVLDVAFRSGDACDRPLDRERGVTQDFVLVAARTVVPHRRSPLLPTSRKQLRRFRRNQSLLGGRILVIEPMTSALGLIPVAHELGLEVVVASYDEGER